LSPLAPPPRPAATLVLVRDTPRGIETLLMQRNEKASFLAGAFVFPGGAVHEEDHAPELHVLCAPPHAHDDPLAALPQAGLGFRAAAIRECFEECGLLLAVDGDGGMPAIDAVDPVWREQRRALASGQATLQSICAERGLRLATERLAGFAHWVTPPGAPRRFDTRFFVAVAPLHQQASHDASEAIAHLWIRPADALARARAGDLKLVFATTTTMTWLAEFDSAQAVVAFARTPRAVPVNEPRAAMAGSVRRVLIRGHQAYAEVCRLDPLGKGQASCELLPGAVTELAPSVRRVAADGANSYLVGIGDDLTVIDPGPDDAAHRQALLVASEGHIRTIVLAHAGPLHGAGAGALKAATGACLVALPSAASGATPDRILAHDECLAAGGVHLRVLDREDALVRGLLLEEEAMLFGPGADMAWPDGVHWHAPGRGFLQERQPFPGGA